MSNKIKAIKNRLEKKPGNKEEDGILLDSIACFFLLCLSTIPYPIILIYSSAAAEFLTTPDIADGIVLRQAILDKSWYIAIQHTPPVLVCFCIWRWGFRIYSSI